MSRASDSPFKLESWVTRQWRVRGVFALACWPLQILYRFLIALRRASYRVGLLRAVRLPVPVIVVGNVTVGGAGKTPLVIHLCERLQAAGLRPGVISRGYGGRSVAPRRVLAGSDPSEVGDEPVLIVARTGVPVWVARARAAAGAALLAAHPEVDVIVADDGLQHLALARDFEIVVMDERGAGNGWMLPAGPLREPLSRLTSVDALVCNGAVPASVLARVEAVRRFAMRLEGERFDAIGASPLTRKPEDFSGQRVHALAGIGNPSRFFGHLRALGLDVCEHAFPDHHFFSAKDLAFDDGEAIVMTEKDAVKCAAFSRPDCWVLRVDARIEPDLMPLLREAFDGCKTA